MVNIADVESALRPDTVLISIMHANNEVGTIQPMAEIAALARTRGIRVHTDAAQSAGKIPVDVAAMGVDLLSLAGHKLYAPKGVGALASARVSCWKPSCTAPGRDEPTSRDEYPQIVGLGRRARSRPGTWSIMAGTCRPCATG
jgi:cysteine desulfurase